MTNISEICGRGEVEIVLHTEGWTQKVQGRHVGGTGREKRSNLISTPLGGISHLVKLKIPLERREHNNRMKGKDQG